MNRWSRAFAIGGAGAALIGAAGLLAVDRGLFAADHLDPPARTDPAVDTSPDMPADIADVYAWHTATNLIIAVTFSGPQATNLPAAYDRNMLYTINISNDAVPFTPEFQIRYRFGQNGAASGGGIL